MKQRFLARDIKIERPGRNARRPRHVGHLGAFDAHVGETGHRGLGDVLQSILGLASHRSPLRRSPKRLSGADFVKPLAPAIEN